MIKSGYTFNFDLIILDKTNKNGHVKGRIATAIDT